MWNWWYKKEKPLLGLLGTGGGLGFGGGAGYDDSGPLQATG